MREDVPVPQTHQLQRKIMSLVAHPITASYCQLWTRPRTSPRPEPQSFRSPEQGFAANFSKTKAERVFYKPLRIDASTFITARECQNFRWLQIWTGPLPVRFQEHSEYISSNVVTVRDCVLNPCFSPHKNISELFTIVITRFL